MPSGTAAASPPRATPVAPLDPLPRHFGRYTLFDRIGEGGMARIYLARAKTQLGGVRLVVVKQILPLLSRSAQFCRLLIQEAKLAASLSHSNIVQVLDLGREESLLYIAMEYVEGFDLRQLVRHCSRQRVELPIEFALHIVTHVLQGLDFAHRRTDEQDAPMAVVHRDVSPSNVLLSFDGEVKLCDFGIARALEAGQKLAEEAVIGKAGYMSPEAASGAPLDARSDVFSVGVILWELIAGARLYRAAPGQLPAIEQARRAQITLPVERGYPRESQLRDILRRALEKSPANRYESARAMLRDLEDYIANSGLIASPLHFGEWMMKSFGGDIVKERRARERAAMAVEAGPLLEISPLGSSQEAREPPPSSHRGAAPPSPRRARRKRMVAAPHPEVSAPQPGTKVRELTWALAFLGALLLVTLLAALLLR
ncbi:MAG TPA: serine/threonine-protein kinase [Polyangiaceae bacterium]|jgi:serine/threonine-protein kinase